MGAVMSRRERFTYVTLCAAAVVFVLGVWALAIDGIVRVMGS